MTAKQDDAALVVRILWELRDLGSTRAWSTTSIERLDEALAAARRLAQQPGEAIGYASEHDLFLIKDGVYVSLPLYPKSIGDSRIPLFTHPAAVPAESEAVRAEQSSARNCEHKHVIRGNDYGRDLAWCDDCGEITWASDLDWPESSARKYSERAAWAKVRVIAFGCVNEAEHGKKACAIWCNHDYCPHTLRARGAE